MQRNWKTTTAGILAIALAGLQIYTNPASLADPQILGAIVAGIGLITAKDHNVSGEAKQQQ